MCMILLLCRNISVHKCIFIWQVCACVSMCAFKYTCALVCLHVCVCSQLCICACGVAVQVHLGALVHVFVWASVRLKVSTIIPMYGIASPFPWQKNIKEHN